MTWKKNEEITSSCENSEPSLHNAPITPAEIENKGNAHGAALMDGEASFDVLERPNPSPYATVASITSRCFSAVRIQPARVLFLLGPLLDS